jgi:hypothetical protein
MPAFAGMTALGRLPRTSLTKVFARFFQKAPLSSG